MYIGHRGLSGGPYWYVTLSSSKIYIFTYSIIFYFTYIYITEALRLVLENNYFKFDGELWHQLVGTAMGTNVAVIYAILSMAYLERKLYTRVNEMYPADYAEYIIKNWRRFIDDCFLIWNSQYHLGEFFDMLNNLDDNIKFTMEKYTDKLPFLDIMVMIKEDGTISTDIFYKTINTHRYLDFRSCHKRHVKINVPFNISRKLSLVVSNKNRLDHRLKELKGFLFACNYPAKVIDEPVSSAKDKTQHQVLREMKMFFHSLSYIIHTIP